MTGEFIGRLHPLLVHLPIGFLILAFLFELLSLFGWNKKLKRSVTPAVVLGTLATVASVISGLLLSGEGGYEEDLLFRHKLFAFLTTGFCIMLLVMLFYGKTLPKSKRKPARVMLFVVLILGVTITGHFGGSLTHGRDYLFGNGKIKPETWQPVSNPKFLYADVIRPILNQKCYGCHGSRKQKGQLRLDTEDFIKKGGKHGSILKDNDKVGNLVRRISLSIEEEDHMPPREKDQLTNLEVEIISDWIAEGASFTAGITDFKSTSLNSYLAELKTGKKNNWWPAEEINPADPEIIMDLKRAGIRINKISENSNYLELVVGGDAEINEKSWEAYEKIADHVLIARFSFSPIKDDDLRNIIKAKTLRFLYLDHTKISDAGIATIKPLSELIYLNLVQTSVTTNGLRMLSKHPSLKELFIYGTPIDRKEAGLFASENPGLRLDTGFYKLPVLPTDTIIFKG